MKTKYKFIHFKPNTSKQDFWHCLTNKGDMQLGIIAYYQPWKQWILTSISPYAEFSSDCLEDIQDFIYTLSLAADADKSQTKIKEVNPDW